MQLKSIPIGGAEIQPGLWAAVNVFTMNGVEYSFYDIYSSEGYHFWEVQQPENYNEDGELLPLNQRAFSEYARTAYRTIDELNANFKSVKFEDDNEVSVNPEI